MQGAIDAQLEMHGFLSASHRRIVNDVIMDQRSGVNKLCSGSEPPYLLGIGTRTKPAADDDHQGANPLTA
ncbi:hypothetical protein D3C81_2125980 [compost metagenome]